MHMSKNLAIITARGGSKRIPRKNIKPFLGQPIIKYSIDAAINSAIFEEIMVSTDDDEIAVLSRKYGAKVPFMRSDAKSDDYSSTADVINEVLYEYIAMGRHFNNVFCIYPTAPFINAGKLQAALRLLIDSGADTVIPVALYSYPIQRALIIKKEKLKMIWPENINKRSQDLLPTYHDIGQFYCLKVDSFLRRKEVLGPNTIPIIIPDLEIQDLDNEEDWRIAELKFKILELVK